MRAYEIEPEEFMKKIDKEILKLFSHLHAGLRCAFVESARQSWQAERKAMRKAALLGMFGAMTLALPVMAQEQPQRGPGPGGPPMMRRMQPPGIDRIKEALNVSDEQWKTLEPKIQKVQELRRDLNVRGGPMMFGGPGGGMGGPGGRGMLQGRRGFRGGPGGPGNDGAGAPPPPPGADNQPPGGPGGAGGPPPANEDGAGAPPPGDPNGAGGPQAGNRPDGRRDGARRPGARHRSDVQAKFEDLQALLDEKEPKPEDLKSKIQAFHEAQTKARTQLKEAEDDLRTAVNPLQEAILMTTGVLD